MVQLDWLRQRRRSRRVTFFRSCRIRPVAALKPAEVLEPRSLLSAVIPGTADVDATGDEGFSDPGELCCADGSATCGDGLECDVGTDSEERFLDGERLDDTEFEESESAMSVMMAGIADADSVSAYFSEDEFREYLLKLVQQRWGHLFGQTLPQYSHQWNAWYGNDVMLAEATSLRGMVANAGIQSDTNTQVTGVDEADFVETDGRYLYIARGEHLTILDTQSPDPSLGLSSELATPVMGPWSTSSALSIASTVTLTGRVAGEFLTGDRLTVITESSIGSWWFGDPWLRIADFAWAPWRNWEPQTIVSVFDLSNRSAPSLVSQTTLDGSFRDARAVDGTVYVVVENQLDLPEPLYTDTPVSDDGRDPPIAVDPPKASDGMFPRGSVALVDGITGWGWWNPRVIANRTYESFEDYVARVGDQLTSLAVPHAISLSGNDEALATAESIVRPLSGDPSLLLTVVSIDTTNADAESTVADSASLLASSGSTVYMTPDALYVAVAEQHYGFGSWFTETRINRFVIDDTDIEWQASGVVPGTLINQFAMDEHDGHLRVATHVWAQQWAPNVGESDDGAWGGGVWITQNDNGVYVLDTEGSTLDEVGRVTGLAPGEQLFAARFLDDLAYLVTFLQVDPLFVIDLSDPTLPIVQGELEIPGFSNYLQPIGDGILFGIGQERVPGTWFNQLQVSLFDVSDATSPRQLDREYLAGLTGGAWSEAQYDHHAILYSAEDGLLVLPFSASGTDEEGHWSFEQALAVLRVDASQGIERLGEIHSHEPVYRTVRLGNVLYAISDDSVAAYNLDDLSEMARVELSDTEPWWHEADGSDSIEVTVLPSGTTPNDSAIQTVQTLVNLDGDETPQEVQRATMIPRPTFFVPASTESSGLASSNDAAMLVALAAQIAQNSAWEFARFADHLPPLDNAERSPSLDPLDMDDRFTNRPPAVDLDETTDAVDESVDADPQSVDAFWEEVGERLRNGDEPLPMSNESSSNPEAPSAQNVQNAASKAASATGRKTEQRPPTVPAADARETTNRATERRRDSRVNVVEKPRNVARQSPPAKPSTASIVAARK